jgi:hypothetical protein
MGIISGVAIAVGMIGYLASGSALFGWIFVGGFFSAFGYGYLEWIVHGSDTSYPRAGDVRRAGEEPDHESPILPTNWPGPS